MLYNPEADTRAGQYAQRNGRQLDQQLGQGTDGMVWKSRQLTAIKAFYGEPQFRTELACYQRLKSHAVRRIGALTVPRLVGSSSQLMVVEMTIVRPPYLLDFGKAHLDQEPDHSEITKQQHLADQREIWGEAFGAVQAVLWELRKLGIFYADPNPYNIVLESDPPGPDTP